MNGQYPRFKNSYFYEELTEHFLLTTAELEFVRSCRGNANRQGNDARRCVKEDFVPIGSLTDVGARSKEACFCILGSIYPQKGNTI